MILTIPDSDAFAPLAAPIDGPAYMDLLVTRQTAYETHRPNRLGFPTLIEWFIQPGDENWVRIPEEKRQPKRVTTPRVYRSADSIAEELAEVETKLAAFGTEDCDDNAVVNLSPYSRSRAARNAGRRRFAQLDRDLERYTALCKRRDALQGRLTTARAREARAV